MAGYLIGGRLLTGEITVRKFIPSRVRVGLGINQPGTITADLSLPLTDPVTGVSIDLPNELIPGRDFLGWVENDVIVEAGPIVGDPFSWPYSSTIQARGLGYYFSHRYVLPVLTGGQQPRDVTSQWTARSLRTIIKLIVQQACSWPSAGLPIVYEPNYTGTQAREYPGADMTVVAEAIGNISEVIGGPEHTFRPRWKSDSDRRHVVWDLLTGGPLLSQGGTDHYWDTSVIGAHAKVQSFDRNGDDLATDAYEFGATDKDTDVQVQARAQSNALLLAGYPRMETLTRRNSVILESTSAAYAAEAVARGSSHTEAFTLNVVRDQNPAVGSYWPGDWAKVVVGKNPRIPADTYRMRVGSVDFSATGNVTLQMLPERTGSGYPTPVSNRDWLTQQLARLQARIDETQRG